MSERSVALSCRSVPRTWGASRTSAERHAVAAFSAYAMGGGDSGGFPASSLPARRLASA
eukprot:CAMPEP_0205961534 /NCGR_PEP_ID=MMETSP1459-20131121/67556_1 /ASSEMBLY_ACC=CAM_ASM_001120 /TAXON_ID=41880 /ORGANISM="Pycnococcus provasolii, Strain RCC931" /LENGTH=58 /DNA_ID=CAMNT_0053334253 /DNA_START=63 /DNA_END=236 /DNA_ORIENTATION=-